MSWDFVSQMSQMRFSAPDARLCIQPPSSIVTRQSHEAHLSIYPSIMMDKC